MIATTDLAILGAVESWLRSRPEILVMIRYSGAAGRKEFEFFSLYESFARRLNELPPSTSIIAFREQQLPLRGLVDEDFISTCLSFLSDSSEFLVVEMDERDAYWAAGETHTELRKELQELMGRSLAIGPYPPWLIDNDEVISAVVPDEDGVVKCGIY